MTKTLILGDSSVTTVSAIDPTTGEGLLIPYGTSPDGLTWYAPDGTDITLSGLPEKSISIGAQNLQMSAGATVDIRGVATSMPTSGCRAMEVRPMFWPRVTAMPSSLATSFPTRLTHRSTPIRIRQQD